MQPLIAPSILSANFAHLGDEVQAVLDGGADLIHVDVMDNHYVPNLTIGPVVFKHLRTEFSDVEFDVHLMCSPVEPLIDEFVELGANRISFHKETCDDPANTLQELRSKGVQAGIALNPQDMVEVLDDLFPLLDHVLVMSVKPGFGGQSFMPEVLPKISLIQKKRQIENPVLKIEIDGGINEETIALAASAGAEMFVAGSAVFGTEDYGQTINRLRQLAS